MSYFMIEAVTYLASFFQELKTALKLQYKWTFIFFKLKNYKAWIHDSESKINNYVTPEVTCFKWSAFLFVISAQTVILRMFSTYNFVL